MITIPLFLLTLVSLALPHCIATRVRYSESSHKLSKRMYSEHWHLPNPVKNCTDPQWTMEVLPNTTAAISVVDCRKVLENARFNKGFYEVWEFDSDDYAPITGYQSCVIGVARMDTIVAGGYAIIGNDDIVSAVVEVIEGHKKGNVTGSAGVWKCGPNGVNLQLIVYNGLKGWHGNPYRDAPMINMYGDWSPTTTEAVKAPTVTNVPTETPVKKNVTWEQPRLVYRHV